MIKIKLSYKMKTADDIEATIGRLGSIFVGALDLRRRQARSNVAVEYREEIMI
jgi:hypothetical protein